MCRPLKAGGLGFRELREFNLALLAKQGWTILTRPASLLRRVLKAKYFPTTSFGEACIESRPSLTWRGICAARSLLEEGAWQESNGEWRWRFERSGRFSVTSAYKHAIVIRDRNLASSSASTLHLTRGRGSLRSLIWRTAAPPKVKLLMWKLCVEALPVLEGLARRAAGVVKECAICGAATESYKHVFWECPFARQVWALSNLAWRYLSSWSEGPAEWVLGVAQQLDYEERSRFFTFCWALWRHRCKRLMDGKTHGPWIVLRNAVVMLDSYLSVRRCYRAAP